MKELFNKVSDKVAATRDTVLDAVEKGISLDTLSENFQI
jgi:hypothetical protein